MRTLYKILLGAIPLLLATAGFSQTTLTTTGTGYTNLNGCGAGSTTCFITFVVDNTNANGIILTGVSSQTGTGDNGATVTLWESTTSLSGPVTLPTGFTSVATGTISGITSTTINPVLSNISVLIPGNTKARYALQITSNNAYAGVTAPFPTPNSFTSGGVTLAVGDYQIAGLPVGYGGPNVPRFFLGSITFISAIPPCAPPTALSDAATASTASIAWTGSTSTNVGYEYDYGTSPTPPTGPGISVGSTGISLSALTPNTTYYYFVRTVCGPNDYSVYVGDSFKTCDVYREKITYDFRRFYKRI